MPTDLEQLFANGYERGRTLCLTKGPEAARQYLRDRRHDPLAFLDGIRGALWDYEDANGIGHHDPASDIA